MANCFKCGRPIEDENEELCVSCKNPTKKTGISLRPESVFWMLSVLLFIPLYIFVETSKNYLLCLWLMIPILFLFSISTYFELKFYNSGLSRYLNLTDEGFKASVISLIIVTILLLGFIIVGLIFVYNQQV